MDSHLNLIESNSATASIVLTSLQKEVLVGAILGDAYIGRVKPTHNARVRFDQVYPDHFEYIDLLYSIFDNLTSSEPKINTRKLDSRTCKIYSSIAFKSRNIPCLNPFYEMFYKNRVKVITDNRSELLTPI